MSINFPPSFHSGSGVDEKSRERRRKKNKEYITRRIDPPPPPPSGRYRFTDSCNFYTLERRGHDAHKRLKHVRAFIDRSTSSLPPSSFHASGTHRAERWFMGFHNTCNIWQTLLATLFMPRMGHHHPLSLRWWKSGKTAWWKEGEKKKKGKKKNARNSQRNLASPRFENSRCAIPSVGSIRNEPGREKFHGENAQQVRNETDSPYERIH